jgi:hypothetical protein
MNALCCLKNINGSCLTVINQQVFMVFFMSTIVLKPLFGQADSLAFYSGFTEAQEAAAKAWLDDLYSHGVTIKNDSVYFNDETRRIVTDSVYRNMIFPKSYVWEMVPPLLQSKAIKPAVWHLLNLYHLDTTNRVLVLKMILPMDQVLEMDRVMLASFYTYIAFDPEVYDIENGKSVAVRRPDLAEKKLLATKSIVDQILIQRRLQQAKQE